MKKEEDMVFVNLKHASILFLVGLLRRLSNATVFLLFLYFSLFYLMIYEPFK